MDRTIKHMRLRYAGLEYGIDNVIHHKFDLQTEEGPIVTIPVVVAVEGSIENQIASAHDVMAQHLRKWADAMVESAVQIRARG